MDEFVFAHREWMSAYTCVNGVINVCISMRMFEYMCRGEMSTHTHTLTYAHHTQALHAFPMQSFVAPETEGLPEGFWGWGHGKTVRAGETRVDALKLLRKACDIEISVCSGGLECWAGGQGVVAHEDKEGVCGVPREEWAVLSAGERMKLVREHVERLVQHKTAERTAVAEREAAAAAAAAAAAKEAATGTVTAMVDGEASASEPTSGGPAVVAANPPPASSLESPPPRHDETGGVDSPPPRHFSGLWVGEALPAEGMEHEVPVNPIKWSLSLCPAAAGPSAFGAGFFDDAADVPGQPVLLFVLKGEFVPETSSVKITKEYCNRNIPEALKVEYEGKLQVQPRDEREKRSETHVREKRD